ncbi:sugar transferase [Wenxinia saemankumensis]|uniref:Sugar transferase involved in LPS biosynthesis (Colanic, teichoic acid) n=1 Tax=Wenxinia saemankumensis TaxID=1447782 RepID=A0A1M6HZW2_9RHOB|nr:sugar transferase [Wenxinia saemankumensis]SHJ27675.1 Sugar transferase involved in LPS biosynthesis (colanic, teichoic acid) [Wenxinia saemankumensis]
MADGTIEIPGTALPPAGASAAAPARERSVTAAGSSLSAIPVHRRPRRAARRDSRDRAVACAALIGADVLAFALAAALLEPFAPDGALPLELLGLLSAAILMLSWSDGLYPGYGIYPHEVMRRRIVAFAKPGMLAVAGTVLLGGDFHLALMLSSFLIAALFLQPILRSWSRDTLHRTGRWGVSAEIQAEDAQAEAWRAVLTETWQLGFRCRSPGARGSAHTLLVAGGRLEPQSIARGPGRAREVILLGALPGGDDAAAPRPADLRGEIGLRLRLVAPVPHRPGPAGRAIDCALGATLLLAVAPVLLTAAASIYLVDPGPVLYRQRREGLGGQSFGVLKLRTMYRDADRRLEMLLAGDPAARAEWTRYYKLRNDPRILPFVGRALRVSSIDELPQLLNVIRGEMRLVGPRPFPDYHLAALDPAFRARRSTVVPGLTGLWQASARSTADAARQQALDDFYIANRSFWLDLHILCLTPAAVLRGRGAY